MCFVLYIPNWGIRDFLNHLFELFSVHKYNSFITHKVKKKFAGIIEMLLTSKNVLRVS